MNNHFLAEVFAITKKKGGGKAPVISELSVVENGTYEAPTGVDGYSPVFVNVPTGGGGAAVLQSGVNIVDYDGSLVQHYTKEEFLALTEMPSNPSHDGLVAQGWNWSLADAKAYITKYGSLNIGQMYTTDTGDTRIYIHIDENTPQNRLTFYVRFTSSVVNNVDIDWGDGTVETKGSTTDTNYPHTYATSGDYIIKLKVNSGTISFIGEAFGASTGNSIYGSRTNQYSYNRARITRVEVGDSVTRIGISAFYNCYSLISITIPNSITSINDYAFCTCYSLTSIVIPNSVSSIGNYAFSMCYSLTTIAIPNSVTSIGNYAFDNCNSAVLITIPNNVTSIENNTFQYCSSIKSIIIPDNVTKIKTDAFTHCYSLTSFIIPSSVSIIENNTFTSCYSLASITIPEGMTNIKNYAFNFCYSFTSFIFPKNITNIGPNAFTNCYGISEYHLLPTVPPTLSSSAFTNIASDCKIYVPYSADHSILAAYQSANNWSTYASRMEEEPQP